MSQTWLRLFIFFHYFLLFLIGFIFYNDDSKFYIGLQLSSVVIYIVTLFPLNKRTQILIHGLILMTVLELLDFLFGANVFIPESVTTYSKLLMDGIIVFVCSLITAIRYFRHGESN